MGFAGSLCKRKRSSKIKGHMMPELTRCLAYRKQASYFPLHTPSSGRWTLSGLESSDSAFPLDRYHGCQGSGWISWQFQALKILLTFSLSLRPEDGHASRAVGSRPLLASPAMKLSSTRIWFGYSLITFRKSLDTSVIHKDRCHPYLPGVFFILNIFHFMKSIYLGVIIIIKSNKII